MLFIQAWYWLFLLILLFPICLSGIIIFKSVSSLKRAELLIPAGILLGFSVFIFIINAVAFVIKGGIGIIISYILQILLTLVFYKIGIGKIQFPERKPLIFWIISLVIWGGFIYWKASHALIGSDTNIYYSVTASFIKGNFPPLTSWQPEIPLAYHLGAFELLAAFHFFTDFSLEFLHLFFAMIFIFSSIQIVIWIFKRHTSFWTFVLANTAAAVGFISFGFINISWPVIPFVFPDVNNLNQIVIWLRELPTVVSSIEVYGMSATLDNLLYFVFHAVGLGLTFSLIPLLIYPNKYLKLNRIIIAVMLCALALISETIFVAVYPAVFLILLIHVIINKTFKNQIIFLLFLMMLTGLVVLGEGGMITATIFKPETMENTILLFPKEGDVAGDFRSYQIGQQLSKIFPLKSEWLPFRWFHVGIDLLVILGGLMILVIWKLKISLEHKLGISALFLIALFSMISFNIILPKYAVANSNRFIGVSYQVLALLITVSLIFIWENILTKKRLFIKIAVIFIIFWVYTPTIIPSLAFLSKTRFAENKVIPNLQERTPGMLWLRDNIGLNERVMILDARSPHPSGIARAITQSGVLSPTFDSKYKVYTVEPSPEYIDIASTLSPKALEKFRISILFMDSYFFETLSKARQEQLKNQQFFILLTEKFQQDNSWERVYRINDDYFKYGGELAGTFHELQKIVPKNAKYYIDNENNFKTSFLRRPLIFSMREDRDLYFPHGSGVYLNVEVNIPHKEPQEEDRYDYLLLSRTTNPEPICKCTPEVIWKGIYDEVTLWKTNINN